MANCQLLFFAYSENTSDIRSLQGVDWVRSILNPIVRAKAHA